MKLDRLVALTLLLTPALAHAQNAATIHYNFKLTEVYAGTTTPLPTQTGSLSPGVGLMLTLNVEVVPPIGTIVSSQGFTGPIAGLGAASMRLHSFSGGQGTWSHIHRPSQWTLGSPAQPSSGGSILEPISVGQFWPPDPTNPIPDIWRGVWTPDSYAQRVVTWHVSPMGLSGAIIQYGTDPTTGSPLYIGINGTLAPSNFQINIIPAPGAASILLLSGLFACRRRRP